MPCIDYLPSGTNTNSQRVILNDNLGNFGSYREANKVGDEELENDTTESSQNSYPDVLDDYYSDLEALTELPTMRKLKRKWQIWRLDVRALSMGECDLEMGTLF